MHMNTLGNQQSDTKELNERSSKRERTREREEDGDRLTVSLVVCIANF